MIYVKANEACFENLCMAGLALRLPFFYYGSFMIQDMYTSIQMKSHRCNIIKVFTYIMNHITMLLGHNAPCFMPAANIANTSQQSFFAAMAGFFHHTFWHCCSTSAKNTACRFEQEIGSEMLKYSDALAFMHGETYDNTCQQCMASHWLDIMKTFANHVLLQ